MPELPEVETARRDAQRWLVGRRIEEVWAQDDPIVFEEPSWVIEAALAGRRVCGTQRHGKYVWLTLDWGPALVFHFGMTGAFTHAPASDEAPRFCRLSLFLDDATALHFTNARRLGRVRFRDDPAAEPPISKLGPDPLGSRWAEEDIAQAVSGARGPIKSLLLDQRKFAGVGNWVADEVLHDARISPHRSGASLSAREIHRLRYALESVLDRAVAAGADERKFPKSWLFHLRWKAAPDVRTRAGDKVAFDVVGGRTTVWVPGIQR